MAEKGKNSKFVSIIKRYRLTWAFATVAFYLVAIMLVAIVFPDISNLWVSIFVLISGFTAGLATLADLLVSAEDKNEDQQ